MNNSKTKPDAKPDVKTIIKPDVKPDAKPDAKPDSSFSLEDIPIAINNFVSVFINDMVKDILVVGIWIIILICSIMVLAFYRKVPKASTATIGTFTIVLIIIMSTYHISGNKNSASLSNYPVFTMPNLLKNAMHNTLNDNISNIIQEEKDKKYDTQRSATYTSNMVNASTNTSPNTSANASTNTSPAVDNGYLLTQVSLDDTSPKDSTASSDLSNFLTPSDTPRDMPRDTTSTREALF